MDYDNKKLMMCPCKVRSVAQAASCLPQRTVRTALTRPVAPQLAFYCCKEHQLLDRKRYKAACKAALAAQAP